MNSKQFADKMLAVFKKHIPNGHAAYSKFCFGNGVSFNFGLIGDAKDCVSGYRVNDVLNISLALHDNFDITSDAEINGVICLDVSSKSLCIKPNQPHYAMSRETLKFRKMRNTPEKVIQLFEKSVIGSLDIIRKQIADNNLYGQDRIPSKYLEF